MSPPGRRGGAIALAAALGFSAAAGARAAEKGWVQRRAKGLFRCRLPAGWRMERGDDLDLSYRFIAEPAAISVTRYGLVDSRFATPAAFLESLKEPGREAAPAGAAKVSGQSATRWRRRYRRELRGKESSRSLSESTYEESVVLKAKKGFWVLRFDSPDGAREPAGLAVWTRFLKSFSLE